MHALRPLLTLLLLSAAANSWAQATRISGTVVRFDGTTPVVAAGVAIHRAVPPSNAELVASGITAVDGTFDLAVDGDCLPACNIEITAANRIVAPALRVVTAAAGANVSGQDFTAAIPGSIRVRVRDHATQQPIAAARLRLGAAAGTAVAAPQPDGTQLFGSVFPGAANVCVIDDYDTYINECQDDQKLWLTNALGALTPLQLAEGEVRHLTISLDQGAQLTGVLHDSYRDVPIANTLMRISILLLSGDFAYEVDLRTDALGNYRVRGIPPSAFRLQVSSLPGGLYYSPMRYPGIECFEGQCAGPAGSFFTVSGTAVAGNAGFDLFPGAVVRGQVRDAASNIGIAGVDVIAYAPGGAVGPFEVHRAISDIDGRYAIAHIPPQSTHRLGTSNMLGYANRSYPDAPCTAPCANGQDVEFAPGVDAGAYDFSLTAARAIAGRIDLHGANGSASTTSVTLYRAEGGQLQSVWSQSFAGDADFVSPGLDAGTYYAAAFVSAASVQCQVFHGQACPAAGGPIVIGQATPIVLPAATGIYPGTTFGFSIDAIFANGIEPAS